jgi:transposase
VPEFGHKTVAVLRAELGDIERFSCVNQVVAYAGLDIKVKESGKWKGHVKLSKQGSGRIRRVLAPFSTAQRPFGRVCLWGVLSSPGGTRDEKGEGVDGSHAQNADRRSTLAQNRGALRRHQSE